MRRLTRCGAVAVAVLLLAGCSGGGGADTAAAGPVAATPTASASATTPAGTAAPTTSRAAAPTAPAGNGCAPNSATIPRGAHVRATQDLDLDGDRDQLWLADAGTKRILGVRTATGDTFSTTFTSAAPQAASAIGARLSGTDASVVLLDTGRSVALYAVVDCELVPARNAQNQPYTFDLGFTGYGTGVACPDLGSGPVLAGLLAEPGAGSDRYTVTRTVVDLADYGRTARNGATTTLAKGAALSDPAVKRAMTVTCGADNPPVTEPQG